MSEFGRRRSGFAGTRRRGPRSRVVVTRRFRRAARRRRVANPRTGGFLGQELKFYDQKLVNSAILTNTNGSGIEADPSATVLLNTVTEGNGEKQRNGRKMIMKSIFVSGTVTMAPDNDLTAPEIGADIAIWLILDKQTNGATIDSENVFVNPSVDISGGTSLLRNLQFSSRFRVLAKATFTMQRPSMSGDSTNFDQGGLVRKFMLSANLRNMPVLFSDTAETVANIIDNSLHILATCTSAVMTPTITYNSRLRFVG